MHNNLRHYRCEGSCNAFIVILSTFFAIFIVPNHYVSLSYNGNHIIMINALIILVSIALVGFVGYDLIENDKKKKAVALEERRARAAERDAVEKAQKEKAEAEYAAEYGKLVSEYGEATNYFVLGLDKTKISNYLYVFEEPAVICLKGEIIPFKKILGFNLNDDSETIMKNETSLHSTTTTKTGSMLGRAAVGGILLGGVGALAGATTAKKETVTVPSTTQTSSTVKHKYILFLNVDDLASPIREIKLGTDTAKAQTIANVFNVIVQRNK